jgi:acetate kinase
LCRNLKAAGDERAALALDMFVYRVRKYIGAYSATLSGRVDALVFSAGIGENSSIIRGLICEDMQVRAAAMEFAAGRSIHRMVLLEVIRWRVCVTQTTFVLNDLAAKDCST